jgi:hypothetical protein
MRCREYGQLMRYLLMNVVAVACAMCVSIGSPEIVFARDASAARTVTVQGDSLTVGMRASFAQELSGWRVLSWDAAVGRHHWDARSLLRRQRLGDVIVFALGTNDWRSDRRGFVSTLRDVLRVAGPRRCVVIPTIYDQRPIAPWNQSLRSVAARSAGQLMVAEWAAAVQRGYARLSDGVHPADRRSWRIRAKVVADAARTCRQSH